MRVGGSSKSDYDYEWEILPRQAFTPPAITGLVLGGAGWRAFVGELSRDRERNGQIYSDLLRFSQMRAPQFRGRGRGGRGQQSSA